MEFARQGEQEHGHDRNKAAVEAARTRLRPILMTSFAFILGVLPLAISTGAGANSRIAIGTAVIGGMLTATFLAIFYIPFFFVLVRAGLRDPTGHRHGGPGKSGDDHRGGRDDGPKGPPGDQPLLSGPGDPPLLPAPEPA